MVLGLVIALQGHQKSSSPRLARWLDRIARFLILVGFGISLYDFGGITTFNQVLEIGLVAGFLVGTYLLAHNKPFGYLWYVLMHVSCAWLMKIENRELLFYMQLLSLVFIFDAYLMTRRQKKDLPVV